MEDTNFRYHMERMMTRGSDEPNLHILPHKAYEKWRKNMPLNLLPVLEAFQEGTHNPSPKEEADATAEEMKLQVQENSSLQKHLGDSDEQHSKIDAEPASIEVNMLKPDILRFLTCGAKMMRPVTYLLLLMLQ